MIRFNDALISKKFVCLNLKRLKCINELEKYKEKLKVEEIILQQKLSQKVHLL
jgi:hypothetical protein